MQLQRAFNFISHDSIQNAEKVSLSKQPEIYPPINIKRIIKATIAPLKFLVIEFPIAL